MLMFRDFTDALGDRVKRQHSSILSFYVFANCIQTLWVIITIYDIFVCTHRGISSPMIIPLLYYIAIGMYIKRTSRRQAKQEVFQREYIYMHLSSSSYLYPACCQPYKYTARRGRTARTCVNVRKGISVISITRQEWFFFLPVTIAGAQDMERRRRGKPTHLLFCYFFVFSSLSSLEPK